MTREWNPSRLRHKSLLMAFILLVIMIILSGCGASRAYKQAKKSWKKIEDIAREYPGIIDGLNLRVRDTVKTTAFLDRIVIEPVVDSAKVDSLALALCAALNHQENTPETPKPPGLGKLRRDLSTLSCPEIAKDTVYFIKVYNSTDSLQIPIHLNVTAKGGRLDIAILSSPAHFVTDRETTQLTFNEPEKPIIFNPWFWNSVGLFIIFFVLIIRSLLRR